MIAIGFVLMVVCWILKQAALIMFLHTFQMQSSLYGYSRIGFVIGLLMVTAGVAKWLWVTMP